MLTGQPTAHLKKSTMIRIHDLLTQDPLRFNKVATYLAADYQPCEVLGGGGIVFRQSDHPLLVVLASGVSASRVEHLLAKNPRLKTVECYLDKEPSYSDLLVKNGFYREHIAIMIKPLAQLKECETTMSVICDKSDFHANPNCSKMVADFLKMLTSPNPHTLKAEELINKARKKLLDPSKQFFFLSGSDGEIAAMGAFVREIDSLIGVSYVYTADKLRRQGYGNVMMRVLEGEAKRRNQGVFLHVNHDNQSAVKFYKNLGYCQHSEFWRYRLHCPKPTLEH